MTGRPPKNENETSGRRRNSFRRLPPRTRLRVVFAWSTDGLPLVRFTSWARLRGKTSLRPLSHDIQVSNSIRVEPSDYFQKRTKKRRGSAAEWDMGRTVMGRNDGSRTPAASNGRVPVPPPQASGTFVTVNVKWVLGLHPILLLLITLVTLRILKSIDSQVLMLSANGRVGCLRGADVCIMKVNSARSHPHINSDAMAQVLSARAFD